MAKSQTTQIHRQETPQALMDLSQERKEALKHPAPLLVTVKETIQNAITALISPGTLEKQESQEKQGSPGNQEIPSTLSHIWPEVTMIFNQEPMRTLARKAV
jgi:hypothetical protein